MQKASPLKPLYEVSPTLQEIYVAPGTSKKEAAKLTRKALHAVNTHYVKKSILQSAIQACPEEKVQNPQHCKRSKPDGKYSEKSGIGKMKAYDSTRIF